MGATNFETQATGATMAEAFHSAVNDAHYWHGHGGYTGTIAEKPGAVAFDVPLAELPHREAPAQEWNRDSGKYETVMVAIRPEVRLVNAIFWYDENRGYWDYKMNKYIETDPFSREFVEPQVPNYVKPEDAEKYVNDARNSYNGDKADAMFLAGKMGIATWKRLCETYRDKWGEAVAIKIADEEWLFLGMASC